MERMRLEPCRHDGRTARSELTREQLIASWISLVDEGVISPTAKDVATHAGIGLRTVFERFADMDALQLAATAEKFVRVAADAPPVAPTGSLDRRITAFTTMRARLYDDVAAVRRAAERQECYSPGLGALLGRWDDGCALDVSQVFDEEFSAMPPGRLAATAGAVAMAWSWSYWNHLRLRRALGVSRSASIVNLAVRSLLR